MGVTCAQLIVRDYGTNCDRVLGQIQRESTLKTVPIVDKFNCKVGKDKIYTFIVDLPNEDVEYWYKKISREGYKEVYVSQETDRIIRQVEKPTPSFLRSWD